jgi:endonuclease/exonuclease/phosphatase family metal-dependent hydrolase
MSFSILSWNVEKFDGEAAQLEQVSKHITTLDPDVFGLFEVENVNILNLITGHLPEYDFNLTDGPQTKEILVGVRRNKFEQSTFSQKREFKVYNPFLRPGALLTLKLDDNFYNVLYVHTDSGTEARDFGNRYEMYDKMWNLKNAVDKRAAAMGQQGNFIILGDLNTMGLLFPTKRKSDRRVSEEEEIKALAASAKRREMSLLPKELPTTFNNERFEADLDHILAAENLNFAPLGQHNGQPFFVKVTGWHQLAGHAKTQFIRTVSDHCSLYCKVQGG